MHAPTPVDNEYFGVGVEYFALRCSPRLLFIGINVLRASYFCLEVSVFLIVCILLSCVGVSVSHFVHLDGIDFFRFYIVKIYYL